MITIWLVVDNGSTHLVFSLQLERTYVRARLAAGVLGGDNEEANQQRRKELVEVDSRLAEILRDTDDVPMARLASRLGLGEDECDFLWMAVAVAVDPRLVPHLHRLLGTEARGLSLGLYCALAGIDGARARALTLALDRSHPLFRYRFLIPQETEIARTAIAMSVSDGLVSFLSGGELGAGEPVTPLAVPEPIYLDPQQQEVLARIRYSLAEGSCDLAVVIRGPQGSGRRTAAAQVAKAQGMLVLCLDLAAVSSGQFAHGLLSLCRSCLLHDALPLIAGADQLVDGHKDSQSRFMMFSETMAMLNRPVVVTASHPDFTLDATRTCLHIDWPVSDHATRQKLWRQALGPMAEQVDAEELASVAHRYALGPGETQTAAHAARLIACTRGDTHEITTNDLVAGVRNNIAQRLGKLAERIEVKQDWNDLVLSKDILDQVRGLIARVRHSHRVYEDWGFHSKVARGVGVPALFSGPPGTGKTLVAGIIAKELGLELLQVDLSQVVSKWIGETEKQLSKVFDAAEAGHALLLFDEADALFSKRTADVKSATDKYANLEVNYLLQRIEAFGGIVVLTTNLDASMDNALKRRLAAHVVFWPPDEEEREQLWQRMLATGNAPVDLAGIDFLALSRSYPDMTGANIRNAVLAAAFLAAAEGTDITHDHLKRAANGEYHTMGRILR